MITVLIMRSNSKTLQLISVEIQILLFYGKRIPVVEASHDATFCHSTFFFNYINKSHDLSFLKFLHLLSSLC